MEIVQNRLGIYKEKKGFALNPRDPHNGNFAVKGWDPRVAEVAAINPELISGIAITMVSSHCTDLEPFVSPLNLVA